MDGQSPSLLLIVRERLRPGREEAYDANERQIAAACSALQGPHPYLALVSEAYPLDVWWLNAFASLEEQRRVDASYAANEALMAAIAPLGVRKGDLRDPVSSLTFESRRDLSTSPLRLAGARFLIVATASRNRPPAGATYQVADGSRFTVAAARNRGDAEDLNARMGSAASILRVRPEWSVADVTWVAADPGFWKP